ncbi:DUF4870 family protein [Rhodospirillum rubrum]|uniref:Membrane protein-like n=1 Tax=Rhodospirillum rubrum (strain ATCC 11170 / ATH 1.1.1 / DSM 467 / LMG 4362 / NCIMB 8255 / S1) TaxID=269796 RepID=Q2RTG0_RHORT|nr:hypothetical protein [Rhodospirillum rubrum]ABC22585.1 membrane protein-like [Rhodospirillum rubrum ATCC 11170]MBK5954174.1 hypothetical protein [Rhodospirillum rubrum]QXG82210.1 hypothetical protein KUL73_09240 [Rhodospirillum rubrum]HAP99407.1 hypothetical protein [Rhodospirillum rubrum]HCF18039.1 hypothetical protein [Rhodospirillum rubrum]
MTEFPTPKNPTATVKPASEQTRKVVNLIYILFALGMFILSFPFAVIGAILAYHRREEFVGTVYESHIEWLLRTFVFTAGALAFGIIMIAVKVGSFFIIVAAAYFIYRVLKGFLLFNEDKAIDKPRELY